MKRVLPILFFVVLSLAVGYISMLVQEPSMQEWYPALVKSSLTPPPLVFAIVWPLLYILMGISAGMLWNIRSIYRWLVLLLFFVQLGLNMLWSLTFFGMQAPLLGLVVLVLLLSAVALYVTVAYMLNHVAAYLNYPYVAWLLFALYLNGYVAYYN